MNAPRRHPLVKSDIEGSARWYDNQKPGLGTDFIEEVVRVMDLIARQPLRFSIRFGNWRRANLQRFPYAVFYQIFENAPVIFAVFHARSDHGPILQGRTSS